MAKAIKKDVLIVGAGHAGMALAACLLRTGFDGSILVVGDDRHLPYERPPLSKAALLCQGDYTPVPLHPCDDSNHERVELTTGCSVLAIDPDAQSASLSDGRRIKYDWCVLATGGRPRGLLCPGARLPFVHQLRNLDDATRLRAALGNTDRLVIIGGGYIGLEVAASARMLGKQVDVIETQGRVLSRATSRIVSRYLEGLHQARGVRFHFGCGVAAIERSDNGGSVVLEDGTSLAADLVLVGIGIDADTRLAEAAGIACHHGVLVDSSFRSSSSSVLAIGDCARHPNAFAGGLCRLESVQHAQDSAAVAANTILGLVTAYHDVPIFWSEQYDVRLQSAGICTSADNIVIRGDPDGPSFSVAYLLEGRIIAMDAINAPREFMLARKLIGQHATVDPELLADDSVSLKAFA